MTPKRLQEAPDLCQNHATKNDIQRYNSKVLQNGSYSSIWLIFSQFSGNFWGLKRGEKMVLNGLKGQPRSQKSL